MNEELIDIEEIASKINLEKNDIDNYYGKYAKIKNIKNNKYGKLILVTSTNPTPYGEGKTTLCIGINDALRRINKNSIAVLREPSMGPVFGKKGGATGGGKSIVIPSEDINLHFTGDMHAITYANNLISAIIDNSIYQGNILNINPNKIVFKRCLDINDRMLRNIKTNIRDDQFQITAASQIMSTFCLSKDIKELEKNLDDILIGYTYLDKPVFLKSFNITSSLIKILKHSFMPNLVQSLEHNPVIIHGGPFANIAHGCSSVVSLIAALNLSDYVITEAGFGSDLGAEKFYDITVRKLDVTPSLVIINTTVKALKYNGEGNLKNGICNLESHINNMKLFNSNILVVLNKYENDLDEDIFYIKEFVNNMNVDFQISTSYLNGSIGAINIARYIINLEKENKFKYLYDLNDSIEEKINKICTKIYHSNKIVFNKQTKEKIDKLKKLGCEKYPICIAKTPFSFSHDKNKLGNPTNYDIEIKDIKVNTGAKFIIVYLDNILTMPGLPNIPNAISL